MLWVFNLSGTLAGISWGVGLQHIEGLKHPNPPKDGPRPRKVCGTLETLSVGLRVPASACSSKLSLLRRVLGGVDRGSRV